MNEFSYWEILMEVRKRNIDKAIKRQKRLSDMSDYELEKELKSAKPKEDINH